MAQTRPRKFIAICLLIATIGTSMSGFLLAPKQAQAQSLFAVPTFEEWGNLSSVTSVGTVSQVTGQPSLFANELLQSQTARGLAEAWLKYGPALANDFESQATADVTADTEALVEGSEFTKLLYKENAQADEAVANPTLGEVPSDVNTVFEDFLEKDIVSSLPSPEVQRRAYEQYVASFRNEAAAAALQTQMQTITVGAVSQFASSISCGGINANALRNAGNFMAVATTGVLRDQIDSSLGLDYYRQMAILGSPNAVPDYWNLVWQDAAATHEAAARANASLQFISPGLKTPTRIQQVSVIDPKTGQEKKRWRMVPVESVNALTNFTANNSRSIAEGIMNLGKSAAVDFVTYDAMIAALYASDALLGSVRNWLSTRILGGLLGKVVDTILKIEEWKGPVINFYAGRMASYVVQFYMRRLLDATINRIFRGRMLAGSYGCRQKARLTDFRSSVDASQPLDVPNIAPPGTDDGTGQNPATGQVVFYIRPENITTPEALATGVFLEWNAELASIGLAEGEELEVILSDGSFGGGQIVGTVDSATDFPQVSTTYTLRVNAIGPGGSRFIDSASASVQVNLEELPPPPDENLDISSVDFDILDDNGNPVRSVSLGTVVDVVWDASAMHNVTVEVYANGVLIGQGPTSSGPVDYTVDGDVQFVIVVRSGEQVGSKTIVVTAFSGTTAGAFVEAQSEFNVRE